jgi:hypothetical protein
MAEKFISVDISGGPQVAAALRQYGERARLALMGAVRLEAELLKTEVQDIHVPIDLGNLKNSAFVSQTDKEVTLGFGGPSAPYGLIVHENLHARHPHGHAKYLEQPFKQKLKGLDSRLAATVKATVGR